MIILLLKNPWPVGGIPWLFHNFPWPRSFSMTFQAWKIPFFNSMTFHAAWERCTHRYKWQTKLNTERAHGSRTPGNHVHSSPILQLVSLGDPAWDELVGRNCAWSRDHNVGMDGWIGARGASCGYAAGGSRGTTCHTPYRCAASPGASETHAVCNQQTTTDSQMTDCHTHWHHTQ